MCVFPGSGETSELEDDPDLALLAEEAEAWSVTVDKKVQFHLTNLCLSQKLNIALDVVSRNFVHNILNMLQVK